MKRSNWNHWADNQPSHADPLAPRTLEDLRRFVRDAAEAGKRIRPAGDSYSWAPLMPSEGVIILMHHLDRMLDFDVEGRTIEIECGMTIEALNAIAAAHGMTLASPTLSPKPTVGGAVAGGCHGTNRDFGNFSDLVEEMTIVTADGSVRTIRSDDPDFPAAQVSLGTFGIIYSLRLRIVPQYVVRLEKRYLPVDDVIDGFEDLQASAQHLELFWFPFQEKMWVYIMNETTDHPEPSSIWRTISTDFVTAFENHVGGEMLPRIARHMPGLTPLVSKIADHVATKVEVQSQTASKTFHLQKVYPKCWDLSYSFPQDQTAAAWREGIALVNDYRKAGLYPVNLPLHGRFTGSGSALIAPDHGRKTGYIEVVTAEGTPHWQEFLTEMDERWFAIPESRPHWCNLYGQWGEIKGRYPRMDEFLAIRDRWDPDRVFLNEFLEKAIFQLPSLPEFHEMSAILPDAPVLPLATPRDPPSSVQP